MNYPKMIIFDYGETLLTEENAVGFIHIGYRGSNVAWIEDIYVDISYRNQGIASKAIELAEEMVRKNPNYTAICLDVAPRNELALKLYHKLGFDAVSIITVRKEFNENKMDKQTDIFGHKFNY